MKFAKARKSILSLTGIILTALSTLFHIIGFSTPNWLESFPQARSRFDKLGLWSACFIHFGYDRDSLGKEYNGCHWIYSYEYRPIFDWLNPKWLLTVQIMMTLVLIINLITCALSLLGRLDLMLPYHQAPSQFVLAGMMFLSDFLMAISVILFGVQSDVDRQWIPRPDQNYLSWSFGLVVVAGFFGIFAAMCFLFDGFRLKFEEEKQSRAADPYKQYKKGAAVPQY